MALQYGLPGRDKLGRENFPRISAIGREIRRYLDGRKDAYVSVVGERKRGTSQSEVPLFVWIGSPGRTRTCDQPVNSRLLYQLSYRGTRQFIFGMPILAKDGNWGGNFFY